MDKIPNIAKALTDMAESKPFQPAVIFPAGYERNGKARYIQYSFRQLNELCDRYAHGLTDFGIRKGNRVLLLVKPGVELIAVSYTHLRAHET